LLGLLPATVFACAPDDYDLLKDLIQSVQVSGKLMISSPSIVIGLILTLALLITLAIRVTRCQRKL
jgi:hypothetical protein